jgi:hypothetical protein
MAISRVQKVVDARTGGVDSGSVALTGVVAGNMLVLTSAVFFSAGDGTTVVSGGAASWALDAECGNTTIGKGFIHRTSSATGGSTTVTCNPNGANADIDLTLSEYSGHDASPLDQVPTETTGSGTAPNISSGTLTQAAELIVAFMTIDTAFNGTITPDATYTEIGENQQNNTGQAYSAQDKIVAVTTSDQADWTLSTSEDWRCCMATYKASAGGTFRTARLPLLGAGRGSFTA